MMSHIVAYQPPNGQGRLAPISPSFLIIIAARHEMNVNVGREAQ
jgi:hypothetical protein